MPRLPSHSTQAARSRYVVGHLLVSRNIPNIRAIPDFLHFCRKDDALSRIIVRPGPEHNHENDSDDLTGPISPYINSFQRIELACDMRICNSPGQILHALRRALCHNPRADHGQQSYGVRSRTSHRRAQKKAQRGNPDDIWLPCHVRGLMGIHESSHLNEFIRLAWKGSQFHM
ncbi:hypothetical protein BDZ45DRAFT_681330 [Acephala macrosclerotiorum]|nr:hypothetical protein BDZ45DRAFT_681330 [Acephala macrosclerotiorum]